ncbi:MAG: type II toxin-antitoxin system RelE/ParE family toxin [Bacteroidales bacterium]|nr:type II toxin-antitoxin system RelE/ParE family toxin [Bacteroidales bacterium]
MTAGKVIYTSGAEADIKESYIWYEAQQSGLGDKFLHEIDTHAIRILKNPDHFPEVLQNIHKANFIKFPFSIFFVISKRDIYVIAIFHNSRNPQIWKNRTIK